MALAPFRALYYVYREWGANRYHICKINLNFLFPLTIYVSSSMIVTGPNMAHIRINVTNITLTINLVAYQVAKSATKNIYDAP